MLTHNRGFGARLLNFVIFLCLFFGIVYKMFANHSSYRLDIKQLLLII